MKKDRRKKYKITEADFAPDEIIEGLLQKHPKGFGFVTPDYDPVIEEKPEDLFVGPANMGGAMTGDRVRLGVFRHGEGTKSGEGLVLAVLQRGHRELVGTFEKSHRYGFVVPEDKKLRNEDIFVSKANWKNAQNGDKVVVEILKYPENGQQGEGRITEIVSRYGEPGGDIKAMARSYNLFETFPSRVNAEAKAVSKVKAIRKKEAELITDEDLVGRQDLRAETIITIDGKDSKDLDDAVTVKRLKNGNYALGVHIADVTNYVAEDGPLDKEAFKRGTSVYLIDQVIPMLPKLLSNGVCSLNEGVDRLTLSCTMEIDGEGNVVDHQIFKSVINSSHRMVYDDVSDMLEKEDAALIEKYKDIYPMLKSMESLAEILRARRMARGSLDFDFDEAHIELDKEGIPVQIGIEERRCANRMIEEFMLAANETVAEHFFWMEAPFLYRVHEKPDMERIEELKSFIRGFGIHLRGSSDNIHPKELSGILSQVKDKTYENVVNTVMLRSMKKAFYSTGCDGHFGLGVKYYCHFTSPIRRYPDLFIHRVIKKYLDGQMDLKAVKDSQKKASLAADQSSKEERRAQELEREVEKLKKTEYMTYHIGQHYEGIISGVTSYGFYVELPNTVEGLVRIESITDDYYTFEPEKYRFIGDHTARIFALGDKVEIVVERADVENREIDFSLAKG